MRRPIEFGPTPSPGILAELEARHEKRDAEGMISRALAADSNILLLNEVLTCVKEGPVAPGRHQSLLDAVGPSLNRKAIIPATARKMTPNPSGTGHPAEAFLPEGEGEPAPKPEGEDDRTSGLVLEASRELRSFTFVREALPGSCLVDSDCASPDGSLYAYLTASAVSLQEDRTVRGEVEVSIPQRGVGELRKSPPLPRLVNIVSFDPYEAWSLKIEHIIPNDTVGSIVLIGMDARRLYLVLERGATKRFYEIGLRDGLVQATHDLGAASGAVELQVTARRLCWIDLADNTLVSLDLESSARQSLPLELPPLLSSEDLHKIVGSRDEALWLILVAPRAEISGIAFGTMRIGGEASTAAASSIRWWSRRELLLARGFEAATATGREAPSGDRADEQAFYLFDSSCSIRKLTLNTETPFRDLNPLRLLTRIDNPGAGKRSLFPRVAVATERPLVAAYDQAIDALQLWDTTSGSLLISLPCPAHLESIHFAAHDSLLITSFRSMRGTWAPLAITFVDFLLLAGQAPRALTEDLVPLLEPLLAWSPESRLPLFMQLLAKFNSLARSEEAA